MITLLAFSLLPLCKPKKDCFLYSITKYQSVIDYKRQYAALLGLDHSEPDVHLKDSAEEIFDNGNQCGKPAIDVNDAIISGHDAPEKAWPWQASIFVRTYNNEYAHCGGSLISNFWVLTAAHCVFGIELKIFLGLRNLSTVRQNVSTTQVRGAEKIIVHNNYETNPMFDIALIKLNSEAVFTEYVRPICLPKPGQTFEDGENEECYATGWGRSNHSGKIMPILQQAKINSMPQSLCIFTCSLFQGNCDRRTLCLDLNDERSGTCNGDSGGPLACKVNGRFVLAGITQAVARRFNCSFVIFPAIDVRVTEYLNWIAINVRDNAN